MMMLSASDESLRQVDIKEFPRSSMEIALHLSWKRRKQDSDAVIQTSSSTQSTSQTTHVTKKRRTIVASKTPHFRSVKNEDLEKVLEGNDGKKKIANVDKEESYRMALALYHENKNTLSKEILRQDIKSHRNLYDILPPFFNEFWEMKFENRLSVVFFSCITRSNCDELGLPKYFDYIHADDAVSLANIKVKMDMKHYNSLVEFTADFRTMYQNVFDYFPADSEEVEIAKDLKKRCERRRKSTASKLKW